jgi:hypothetical protein
MAIFYKNTASQQLIGSAAGFGFSGQEHSQMMR